MFRPRLIGATLGGRLLAGLGAAMGIALSGLVGSVSLGLPMALLIAPMGASAVLIFAVPASPLAQPRAVIGGNVVSAFIGVGVAKAVPDLALAAGLAVGAAIIVMSLLRCLHPPGGAAALTAVIGGPTIAAAGWSFPILPIAVDSVLLVLVGIAFHRVTRHPYPHRAAPAFPTAAAPHPQDVDRAIADLGESFDISREDLDALLARVAVHAEARRRTR